MCLYDGDHESDMYSASQASDDDDSPRIFDFIGYNQNERKDLWRTTGKGTILMRNIDSYMNTSELIQPRKLIFLLKMKEL
jgi:hypothetical protein